METFTKWLGAGSINIFGMPFAGKDTLAHNLSLALSAPVVSGGDVLRSHPDQETIKELMLTGELFPTDYYLSIVLPYISQSKFTGKPLVLSSLGRWHGEEPVILSACKDARHPIKAVIYLKVPAETIWQRFEASQNQKDRAHRHDDSVNILEIRLDEYEKKTLPVIEYYRKKGLLIEVDGHMEIEDTKAEALKRLNNFMNETV